jgi:hypothetical protein
LTATAKPAVWLLALFAEPDLAGPGGHHARDGRDRALAAPLELSAFDDIPRIYARVAPDSDAVVVESPFPSSHDSDRRRGSDRAVPAAWDTMTVHGRPLPADPRPAGNEGRRAAAGSFQT